jgi:hypothetical protein
MSVSEGEERRVCVYEEAPGFHLGPRDERGRRDCWRVVGVLSCSWFRTQIDFSFHCVMELCEAKADAAGQGATSRIYSRCDVYYVVTLIYL